MSAAGGSRTIACRASGRRSGHLNSVKNSPDLRAAYEQALPLLSNTSTWVGQHEGLYRPPQPERGRGVRGAERAAAQGRWTTRCAISNCRASACRRINSSATARSSRACPNWFHLQQQRARRHHGLEQTNYRRSQAERPAGERPGAGTGDGAGQRAGRLVADAGHAELPPVLTIINRAARSLPRPAA